MLDPARQQPVPMQNAAPSERPKAVFRMIDSDRMAGSIPAWVPASSAEELTASSFAAEIQSAESAAAYSPAAGGDAGGVEEEPFGFGDLLDIVNPLQHIPLVNTLYRSMTGDEIRDSSRVLGGLIFGGFAGAAGSLANVILEEETGKDVTQTALGFVLPDRRTAGPAAPQIDVLSEVQQHNLPGTALSFVDLGHTEPPFLAKPVTQRWKFNE